MNQKTSKCKTIEVVIAVVPELKFQTNGTEFGALEGATIVGIAIHNATSTPKTITNKTVATDTVRKGSFLVMKAKDRGEVFDQIPLPMLDPTTINGQYFEIEPQVFNLAESSIKFPDTSILTAGHAFLITFFYR